MTRLLIVGNSHCAALRAAWRQKPWRRRSVRVTFFAASANIFQQLRATPDGQFGIAPDDSPDPDVIRHVKKVNRRTRIDTTDFDVVAQVGMTYGDIGFVKLITDYSVDGWREVPGLPRLSARAMTDFAHAIAARVLDDGRLGRIPGRRRIIVPMPRPAQSALDADHRRFDAWRAYAERPAGGRALLNHYRTILAQEAAARGLRLVDLPQEILTEIGMIQTRFTSGSPALSDFRHHPDDDHSHMNALYGHLMMARILDAVREEMRQAPVDAPTERAAP